MAMFVNIKIILLLCKLQENCPSLLILDIYVKVSTRYINILVIQAYFGH